MLLQEHNKENALPGKRPLTCNCPDGPCIIWRFWTWPPGLLGFALAGLTELTATVRRNTIIFKKKKL